MAGTININETVRVMLLSINEEIARMEANDQAYTNWYGDLCRKRKILQKALKKLEDV